MKKLIILVFYVFFLQACTTNHGHFTIITNKMLDKSHFKIADAQSGKRVKYESVAHVISKYQIGEVNLSEAIDSAIKQGYNNSDMLVNVNLSYVSLYIPSIYEFFSWEIEGNACSSSR